MTDRWLDATLDVPSLLPLQASPQTEEQVVPYLQSLHNYLAGDRVKIARALSVISYYRQLVGDAIDKAEASGTQTVYIEEDTQELKYDSRTAALAGSPEWRNIVAGDTLHADSDVVEVVHGTGSTYDDLQDFINVGWSSGVISGFTLTSVAGTNTVAVAAGTCLLADTDDEVARVIGFYDYAGGTTAAIADGATKWVNAYYNAGAVEITLGDTADLDAQDAISLGWVTREGSTLHITDAPQRAGSLPHSVAHTLREVLGFARADALGGIILGETGTRNPTLSAGEIYYGLNEFDIDAIDCSGADTFTRYYPVAGTWTAETGLTQWPNAQYSDGTDLQNLNVNRWGALWFYVDLEDGELIMLYGTSNASQESTAEAEAPPATAPERVAKGCVLVGRYIFQNGASSATVQSAFNAAFNPAGVSDHEQLANIGTNTHAEIDTHIASAAGSHPHDLYYIKSIQSLTINAADQIVGSDRNVSLELPFDIADYSLDGHAHVEADITDLDHTDSDAFHASVSAEISALTQVVPGGNDQLLIERFGYGYPKQRVTVSQILGTQHDHTESDITDLDHTDADAIHDNVAGEISAMTLTDPGWGDLLLFEDASDSNAKKSLRVERINRFDAFGRGIILYCQNNSGSPIWAKYLCYVSGDDNGDPELTKADADSAATCTGMLMMAQSIAYDGNSLWGIAMGVVDGFSGLTPGAIQYASTTLGGITETPPSGSGDIVRVIGHAISSTEIFFNPSNSWVEVT